MVPVIQISSRPIIFNVFLTFLFFVGRLHSLADLNQNSNISVSVTEEEFAIELINQLVTILRAGVNFINAKPWRFTCVVTVQLNISLPCTKEAHSLLYASYSQVNLQTAYKIA